MPGAVVAGDAFILAENAVGRNAGGEEVAEGEEGTLQHLLQFLYDGPPQASVSRVESEWFAATGEFDEFAVER